MAITRDDVLRALQTVRLGGGPLTGSGRLSEVAADGSGRVSFAILAAPEEAAALEPVRAAAEAAVKSLPGAGPVFVTLTADRPSGSGPTRPAPNAGPRAPAAPPRAQAVPGVKRIVAVASGKGGVGKSTLSCNLALSLRLQGLSGAAFDRAYMDRQIAAHQYALRTIDNLLPSLRAGASAETVRMTVEMRASVVRHLAMAQQLRAGLRGR